MKSYFVSNLPDPNGEHEVHMESCILLGENNRNLGIQINCEHALLAAKKYYPLSNGCSFCCTTCHTEN